MKKTVAFTTVAGVLLIGSLSILLIPTPTVDAVFMASDEYKGVNGLSVKVPWGYNLIRFKVQPNRGPDQPFICGGASVYGNESLGWFNREVMLYEHQLDDVLSKPTTLPASGKLDVQFEQVVKYTNHPIPSFQYKGKFPEETKKEVTERCGTYFVVTKNLDHDAISDMVLKWKLSDVITEK